MPRITSAKWDRTVVLNIPIFITIWISLRAALEIHFHLIIRHQALGYRLNTYHLEVTGYSDDHWWREFYINFEFSRLQFRSRPIGPTGDGPLGPDGDNLPPHVSNQQVRSADYLGMQSVTACNDTCIRGD